MQGFGAFAVAWSAYALALGVTRAVASEPLAVRHSIPDGGTSTGPASAAGCSVLLGVAAGALVGGIALMATGELRNALLPLAIFLPAILLQDTWRAVFFAAGHPARAFLNDCIWAGALVVAVAALSTAGRLTVGWLVAGWGGAAAVAAVLGVAQTGFSPQLSTARRWLREHRDLWPRFTLEYLAMTGTWQVVMVALAGIAGLAAVGSVRGAQTALGPLNIVFLAAPLVLVPEFARLRRERPERVLAAAAVLAAALGTTALLFGGAVLVLPDQVGTALLGPSWGPARTMLVPIAVLLASTGVNVVAIIGLRALAAAHKSLRARLVVSPLVLVGGTAGALLGGAMGAAYGLALANCLACVVWWNALLSAGRQQGMVLR